jgi:prolyl-tRNA synthetase
VQQHVEGVLNKAYELKDKLSKVCRVKVDDSDKMPGWKFSEYEMRGVPLRLEVGPKDIEKNQVVLVRRDTREKLFVSMDDLENTVVKLLADIQKGLLEKARNMREQKTYKAADMDELARIIEATPGFIKAMWCGDKECEDKIKEITGASARCIPFEQEEISNKCVCCGKRSSKMVYFAKSY